MGEIAYSGYKVPLFVPSNELKMKKCPICGTVFKATHEYVYKRNDTYFCRYNCMRAFDRKKEQKKKKKEQPTSPYLMDVIKTGSWADTENGIIARIALCEKQIEIYKAKKEKAFDEENSRGEKSAGLAIYRWTAQLEFAKKLLSERETKGD